MDMRTIGIVGGGGWLGSAIAGRALAAGVAEAASLTISGRSPRGETLKDWPGIAWTSDNAELVRRSDVVVLSVRPQQFGDLALDVGEKLVVSVMAGIPLAALQERLGTGRVVRTMPNAAAAIGRSYTPWLAGVGVTAEDRGFVQALLLSCGEAEEVPSEQALDYLTGFSGSGPAFPALLADAMIAHAQVNGLPPEVARRAALAVVCGASRLLEGAAETPADTVKAFVDYDGVVAAALRAMMANGFEAAVGAGLDAGAQAAAGMARRFGASGTPA